MSLRKEYVRDGNRRIIGSVITGFSDTTAVVAGTPRTGSQGAPTTASARHGTRRENWCRSIPPTPVFSFVASSPLAHLSPTLPREDKPMTTETIPCPLCSGEGKLKRTEVLDRLGMRDAARVAQLSAEEAFRLLSQKHSYDQQNGWSRFETELAKRTTEIRERHKDELRSAQTQRDDVTRRVENCLREVAQLRERNQQLEAEMSKVARVGKREEMDFAEEARTWAGICISEKLPRNGDFILAYRAPNGDPAEPKILIDNKDKSVVAETDIDKLIRDARERSIAVAALVARDEAQLRQVDREARWNR